MSDNQNQLKPLIIDIGSSKFKLGWAGDDYPKLVVPSIYSEKTDYLFETNVIEGLEDLFFEQRSDQYFYGNDALYYQNILNVHEFKKENNYSLLTKFFNYYYQQLNIAPENQFKQPIIVITPLFITDLEKSKLEQIFFQMNFPYILFLPESQAIMQSIQKTTGVIVNMGESNTHILTILHGFTNIMARDVFPIAGKDLTNYLLNMILTKKSAVSGKNYYVDKWLAKEIKEKTSLCVLEPENEIKHIKEGLTNYNQLINFPDGTNLDINYERFMLAEPLFNPRLIHMDYIGLPEAISKVIKGGWDRENWEEIMENVVLSGGGSLIPGLKERLKVELKKYFSDKINNKINVIAPSGRESMAWIGASILHLRNQLTEEWKPNPEYKNEKGS